jgi:hypothetical protein
MTERQADRKLCSTKADRVSGKQKDWEAGRQEAIRQKGRQSGRQADGLVGRHVDRRYAEGKAGRQNLYICSITCAALLHLRLVMCLHNIMHKIV